MTKYFWLVVYIYIYICVCVCVVPSISFQTFCTGIQNCRRHLKIQYVIAIHLMRWLTNFYDFRFKWTATAGIGIHSTKAWLSRLVNFKNSGAFQKLLKQYNECIAAGVDYFEGDKSFMCVLSIKAPIRKKSGNLFNDPRIYIYIYIYTNIYVYKFLM